MGREEEGTGGSEPLSIPVNFTSSLVRGGRGVGGGGPVSGEKQNSSGKIEILPGSGHSGNFGKYEIIPGDRRKKMGHRTQCL